jgi:hypothetical protein
MSEYGNREVTIVAPFDSTVSATVQEESLPVWLANGWRVGAPDSPEAQAPAPDAQAPQDGVVADPQVQPAPAPVAPVVKK